MEYQTIKTNAERKTARRSRRFSTKTTPYSEILSRRFTTADHGRSIPPGFSGWQRNNRPMPRNRQRITPCFRTANLTYSEHVGEKRQERGKRGDR